MMMATVSHVTSGLGLRKFQADGFLFDRVYKLKFLRVILLLSQIWVKSRQPTET